MAQVEKEPPGMEGRSVMIAMLVLIAIELVFVFAGFDEIHNDLEDLKILLRGLKK